jgi:hypothetical protein
VDLRARPDNLEKRNSSMYMYDKYKLMYKRIDRRFSETTVSTLGDFETRVISRILFSRPRCCQIVMKNVPSVMQNSENCGECLRGAKLREDGLM